MKSHKFISHGNTKDTPYLKDTPFEIEIFRELKIFIKENQYKSKCLRIPPFDLWEIGEKGGILSVTMGYKRCFDFSYYVHLEIFLFWEL